MQALARIGMLPWWIVLGFVLLAAAMGWWVYAQRRAGERASEQVRRRILRDQGYGWSWREFWFKPRQLKLPPPAKAGDEGERRA